MKKIERSIWGKLLCLALAFLLMTTILPIDDIFVFGEIAEADGGVTEIISNEVPEASDLESEPVGFVKELALEEEPTTEDESAASESEPVEFAKELALEEEPTTEDESAASEEADATDRGIYGNDTDSVTMPEIQMGEEEYTESEEEITYDPQPTTLEEVQTAIDAYEAEYQAVLAAEGLSAALEVPKPCWQYEVEAELLPDGYNCQLVDWDEDFGADYYTFFPNPVATVIHNVSAGTDNGSLQTMINAAAAGDTFMFEGNVTLTGTLSINKSLNFKSDLEAGITITSSAAKGRHIEVTGGDIVLTFKGITLKGAAGTISTSTKEAIGGISSSAASLTLEGVNIDNCRANSYGTGIFASGNLTVSNCEITNNVNSLIGNQLDNGGGGIAIFNKNVSNLELNIYSSIISDNYSFMTGGGIILAADDMKVVIDDTIISGNSARGGGGIYAFSGGPTIEISESDILNNTAWAAGGGGIYMLLNSNTLIVTNSLIKGNIASVSSGGGIFLNDEASSGGNSYNPVKESRITITETKIVENAAQAGGGMLVANNAAASLQPVVLVTGKTEIIGNTAMVRGGGISMHCGTLTITGDSAINGNGGTLTIGGASYGPTPYGGGIFLGSSSDPTAATLLMESCSVDNNTVTRSTTDVCGGAGVYVNSGTITMYDGSSIANNTATSNGTNNYSGGGGVYVFSGTLTMNGGSIEGNAVNGSGTSRNGGGIYVFSGECTINAGVISGNTANRGGGMYVSGQGTNSGIVNMSGGSIVGNAATVDGGGVYLADVKDIFNMSSTAAIGEEGKANTAQYGAGVYLYSATFKMDGGTINNNTASISGGGVYLYNNGKFEINSGTIGYNTAATNGGGVSISSGTFNMTNGTIEHNNANGATDQNGGGGVFVGTPNGAFTMSGGEIGNNAAALYGGGLYVAGTANVSGGKIVNNKAVGGDGGGIYTRTATYLGTGDYTNLTIAAATEFSGNSAVEAYIYNGTPPAANIASRFASFTFPASTTPYLKHPLNNYDINYKGGTKVEIYTVTVEYVDTLGNPLQLPLSEQVSVGETYSYTVPDFTDYMFVNWRWDGELKNNTSPTLSFTVTQNTTITLIYDEVEAVSVQFSFYKVDAANDENYLSGAGFSLYYWEGTGDAPEGLIDPGSPASGWELKGTCTSGDGNGGAILGEVKFIDLTDGEYRLVETNAPDDYQLPTGQWRFVINEEGSISFLASVGDVLPPAFQGKGTDGAPYLLGNIKQYELPVMGSIGTFFFTIAGGILLACGTIWAILRFRRRLKIF